MIHHSYSYVCGQHKQNTLYCSVNTERKFVYHALLCKDGRCRLAFHFRQKLLSESWTDGWVCVRLSCILALVVRIQLLFPLKSFNAWLMSFCSVPSRNNWSKFISYCTLVKYYIVDWWFLPFAFGLGNSWKMWWCTFVSCSCGMLHLH